MVLIFIPYTVLWMIERNNNFANEIISQITLKTDNSEIRLVYNTACMFTEMFTENAQHVLVLYMF